MPTDQTNTTSTNTDSTDENEPLVNSVSVSLVDNDEPHADLAAFTRIVESRRSVRKFTTTPIPDDVLKECLRLAMLAPNSSNLQPWEFYVIDSESKRRKAVDICMSQNAAKTATRLIAIVARTDNWKVRAKQNIEQFPDKPVPKKVVDYYSKVVPFDFIRGPANSLSLAKWGVATVFRQVKGPIKTPYYTKEDIKNWATNNAALAAENLMLALRAHGFDSCPMGGFDEPALKKLLNLSDDHHVVMILGAGERAETGIYNRQYRFDYDDFVTHV